MEGQIEFSPRELRVMSYIEKNPGTSMQKVRDAMEEEQVAASVTTFKIIRNLEKEAAIVKRKEHLNSQTYQLFINKESSIALAFGYLSDFEKEYLWLLRKIKRRHEKGGSKSDDPLLNDAIEIYRYLVDLVLSQSMHIWSKEITDEVFLGKLFSTVFKKLAHIHMKIATEFQDDEIARMHLEQAFCVPKVPNFSSYADPIKQINGLQKEINRVMRSLTRNLAEL